MSQLRLTIVNRHGVAEPQQAEHYDKFAPDYSDDEDEDEYDSDELYGFGGVCHGPCCAFHSDEDEDEDEDDEDYW